MKWFKHAVDAHNGRTIQKILKKYGLEGEARYWRLIAICSEKFKKPGEKIAFDPDFVRRSLRHRSVTDTRPFVDWLATGGIIIADLSGDDWLIEIPNISEIRDNHSRNLQVADKRLNRNLLLDKDKDKELDVELDSSFLVKEKIQNSASQRHEDLFTFSEWIAYLKKYSLETRDLTSNIRKVAERFETIEKLHEFANSIATAQKVLAMNNNEARRYVQGALLKETGIR